MFLCNNSDRTWFSNALTFARSLGKSLKPRSSTSVFNTSLGTWQILMHGKPCLIPILTFILCRIVTSPSRQVDRIWHAKGNVKNPVNSFDCNSDVYTYFLRLLCAKTTLYRLTSRKYGLWEGWRYKTAAMSVTQFRPVILLKNKTRFFPLALQAAARCVRIEL